VCGVFVLEKAQKHGEKAVDGVGVLTLGGNKTVDWQRVEGPKCQRMPVDEHQSRLTIVCHSDQPNQWTSSAEEKP